MSEQHMSAFLVRPRLGNLVGVSHALDESYNPIGSAQPCHAMQRNKQTRLQMSGE